MWTNVQFFHPSFSNLPYSSRLFPSEINDNQAIVLTSENNRTGRRFLFGSSDMSPAPSFPTSLIGNLSWYF